MRDENNFSRKHKACVGEEKRSRLQMQKFEIIETSNKIIEQKMWFGIMQNKARMRKKSSTCIMNLSLCALLLPDFQLCYAMWLATCLSLKKKAKQNLHTHTFIAYHRKCEVEKTVVVLLPFILFFSLFGSEKKNKMVEYAFYFAYKAIFRHPEHFSANEMEKPPRPMWFFFLSLFV